MEEEFFSEPVEKPVEEKKGEAEFDEKAFDAQTDEDARSLDPKAGAKFKELRSQLKEFKQREAVKLVPEDTKRELEELRLAAAEREGLKQRISEISSQSAKLQMENEPEYQTQVLDVVADAFTRAEDLAKMYEGDPAILKAIIRERDRKTQNELIAEHLKDFSDFDRSEVYRMVQDFNGAMNNRQRLLANAETSIEKRRAAQEEQSRQLIAEQRLAVQKSQKSLFDKYKEVIPGLVDESGETPAFKSLMSKALAIDFGQAKASDMAFASFAGTMLPHVMKEVASLRKELEGYRAANGKSVKTAPSPGSSVAPTPTGDNSPKTFMDAMMADIH